MNGGQATNIVMPELKIVAEARSLNGDKLDAQVIAGLAASVYGFTFVKQAFFPSSTTPIFQLDVWMPEGTDK